MVDVDVEPDLLAVELLGPIDIQHRHHNDLELPIHVPRLGLVPLRARLAG
jgi:hypothetical protein